MNRSEKIKSAIVDSLALKQIMCEDSRLLDRIDRVIDLVVVALRRGNKVIFAGNGGSAADAQHLAAEFVSRFEFDRPGLPALSLSTDTSMITAIGNDYGYDQLFRRQLQAQSRVGDVFFGISTSGRSPNILSAFAECQKLKVSAVALCGAGGELDGIVDYLIRVPSTHTPRIQECHILIGHIICAEVERELFGHLTR
jgi:D-sedoheptulose 7-phosphate isomerase